MNHDDRQLIAGLFDRMRSVDGLDKDRDAEAFIHQSMRENGDSPYLLVQAVLAQEVALQKADERIRELEAQVQRGGASAGRAAPAGAAPWEAPGAAAATGGAWGAPVAPSAVPSSGRAGGAARQSAIPATGRGRGAAGAAGADRAGQQRGGGFMAQAMTTAAGVAGGMLLASGISSLFSGGSEASAAETAAAPAAETPAAAETAQHDPAPAEDQSGMQQASHEDDWGGGEDDWGGDFEI